MAKISKEQVEHIANLSNLELSEKEKNLFSNQLLEIVKYVEKLNKIETKDVSALFQVTDLKSVWRLDKVKPSKTKKENFLRTAPRTNGDYIKADKIFERE